MHHLIILSFAFASIFATLFLAKTTIGRVKQYHALDKNINRFYTRTNKIKTIQQTHKLIRDLQGLYILLVFTVSVTIVSLFFYFTT